MGTISPTRLCLPDAQKERRNLACGTGAGDDRGHLWLARFAYGLFLPEMRESLDLSETALGYIGAGSYAGYCLAIVAALVFTSRTGPRFMAVARGAGGGGGLGGVGVALPPGGGGGGG